MPVALMLWAAVLAQKVPRPVEVLSFKAEPVVHLYQVTGKYIQFDGDGPRPPKIERYVEVHGELPPSIILPQVPTVFRIGDSESARAFIRKFIWPCKGPLPAEVLESLNENGVLPPHS